MDKLKLLLKSVNAEVKKKFTDAKIKTVKDFVEKSATVEWRKALSEDWGLDERELYSLVKQADLMRIPGVNDVAAKLLVDAGIRSIDDLSKINTKQLDVLLKKIYPDNPDIPSLKKLSEWQVKAKEIKNIISYNPADIGILDSRSDFSREPYIEQPDEFFSDMTDLIVSLGRGISEAQRSMDENTIKLQEEINADEDLRAYGINATWYTIPETTLNLKMNYSVTSEKTSSGKSKKKILISPINARYQNYFKVSESMQSELNLKVIPIPPPSRAAEVIYIPDVTGKTLGEAKEILKDAGLNIQVEPSVGDEAKVTSQDPMPGSEARFKDYVKLGFNET